MTVAAVPMPVGSLFVGAIVAASTEAVGNADVPAVEIVVVTTADMSSAAAVALAKSFRYPSATQNTLYQIKYLTVILETEMKLQNTKQ